MKNRKPNNSKSLLVIKIAISIVLLTLLVITFLFPEKVQALVGYAQFPHQTKLKDIENSVYYVSYIDVGQGNSSYIEFPDGKNMLIDGGDVEYGTTVAKFLNSRHVSTIDYLIATHADSDHIGGLNYVLENFEIKNVFRPFQISGDGTSVANFEPYEYEQLGPVFTYINSITGNQSKMSRVTTSVYKKFIKNIYTEKYHVDGFENSCMVTVFYDGLVISGENYKIEFFSPQKRIEDIEIIEHTDSTYGYATVGYGTDSGASNDNSAVFMVTCYDDRYFFMGDARYTDSDNTSKPFSETDFINSLTDAEKIELAKVDVLLVAHHGSKYSTCTELLEILLPRYAVISCGKDNKYKHPASETLERLSAVSSFETDYLLRTDKDGNIEFSSINGELKYSLSSSESQISTQVIASVIVVVLICVVFSIKPRRRSRTSRKNY